MFATIISFFSDLLFSSWRVEDMWKLSNGDRSNKWDFRILVNFMKDPTVLTLGRFLCFKIVFFQFEIYIVYHFFEVFIFFIKYFDTNICMGKMLIYQPFSQVNTPYLHFSPAN